MTTNAVYHSDIPERELIHRGKVRDIYAVDDQHMLIVTTDRLSAFDVILPQPIPGKGEVLTRVSKFWFQRTADLVPNHLSNLELDHVLSSEELATLGDRVLLVKKLKPLPVEAIVRGYIIGSGWKDYQNTGAICGIGLPEGMQLAEQLPQAIYTPSTKAAAGLHDENIDFDKTIDILGRELAEKVRDLSLTIYNQCAEYALERGIIIADTKFEFGQDEEGELYLIDEVLTPDSSRFWPKELYKVGVSPPSFDKQIVRDYLEGIHWDKTPPGPNLPEEVINWTAEKYAEAEEKLTGG